MRGVEPCRPTGPWAKKAGASVPGWFGSTEPRIGRSQDAVATGPMRKKRQGSLGFWRDRKWQAAHPPSQPRFRVREIYASRPPLTPINTSSVSPVVSNGVEERNPLSRFMRSIVTVKTLSGQGSGFFISSNGFIVTNEHVVNGRRDVIVTTPDGKEHSAEVIATHRGRDLALLKVAMNNTEYLTLVNMENIHPGLTAYAIGAPYGLEHTVTRGIVSSIRTVNVDYLNVEYIQTDAPINEGNSGGPLITEQGEVLGVVTWKVGSTEGLGFAVSSTEIVKSFGEYFR